MNTVTTDEKTYWVATPGDEARGPFTFEQLAEMWRIGAVTADAQICRNGASNWVPMARAMAAAKNAMAKPDYDKGLYRFLALALGIAGAHHFYAKETSLGVAKLVLFALALALTNSGGPASGILLIALAAWTVMDLVRGRAFGT